MSGHRGEYREIVPGQRIVTTEVDELPGAPEGEQLELRERLAIPLGWAMPPTGPAG